MARTSISGVRIAGLASAVPEHVRSNFGYAAEFGEEEVRKICSSSGVSQVHVAGAGMCASDLCLAATQRLLPALGWPADSIDGLIFVSQTPDYLLPATSCSLHGRLGLAKHCAAFDVNLGCSGYIYGLWLGAQLAAGGALRRILVLAGDTISRIVSPQDRSVAMLFGDAGSSTALEYNPEAAPLFFELGTDGAGQNHIRVPAGLFRQRPNELTARRTKRDDANIRSDEDLFMDGAEVFTFTLAEVPGMIKATLQSAGWTIEDTDAFVMHQANQFMLQHLTKRMRLPAEKTVISMAKYGNTSSASVPLAITDCLRQKLEAGSLRLLLAGFGVGLSWGAVALNFGPAVMPELVAVPEAGPAAPPGSVSNRTYESM